jgi:hypothetical protein
MTAMSNLFGFIGAAKCTKELFTNEQQIPDEFDNYLS